MIRRIAIKPVPAKPAAKPAAVVAKPRPAAVPAAVRPVVVAKAAKPRRRPVNPHMRHALSAWGPP